MRVGVPRKDMRLWEIIPMGRTWFERAFSAESPPASSLRPSGLERELAEQANILADEPSPALTYSDLYERLRSGARSVRRLLPHPQAHAAR